MKKDEDPGKQINHLISLHLPNTSNQLKHNIGFNTAIHHHPPTQTHKFNEKFTCKLKDYI